ncbi:hypothetical protein TNCV_3386301 [Trichonephila clavipes]|nr:hypothetical protein TNCV_3386301 [Trichonephila clavipes]
MIHPTPLDEELLDVFKRIFEVLVMLSEATTIPVVNSPATCVSYTKVIQIIEVRRVPSTVFNQTPGECNMEVFTRRDRKMYWCFIGHEPYVLVHGGRCYQQQLRVKLL